MAKKSMPKILLIDDDQAVLDGLEAALVGELRGVDVEVVKWRPQHTDGDPLKKLETLIGGDDVVLVATDYDLTSGMRGLFGLTIVAWCQQRSVPVGDFSRGNVANLPKEPNLFELRIPSDEADGAKFIASTFKGFAEIKRVIVASPDILSSKRSLAAVLATLLDKGALETQFALYMARLGAANSSLLERLKEFTSTEQPSSDEKVQLLTYVLGHVMLNAILKYPGPILSDKALCAYVATSDDEAQSLSKIFEPASYRGPFEQNARFFWRDKVDAILDDLGKEIADKEFEMFADFNRAAVEKKFGRDLGKHGCERCGGTRGGFLCPFTQRPVCLRPDCSVSASSWIPQGAQLCRVERTFYEEWAPLLGL